MEKLSYLEALHPRIEEFQMSTAMNWSRGFDAGTAEATEVASARHGQRFGEGRTSELVDGVGLRKLILAGPSSTKGLYAGG